MFFFKRKSKINQLVGYRKNKKKRRNREKKLNLIYVNEITMKLCVAHNYFQFAGKFAIFTDF